MVRAGPSRWSRARLSFCVSICLQREKGRRGSVVECCGLQEAAPDAARVTPRLPLTLAAPARSRLLLYCSAPSFSFLSSFFRVSRPGPPPLLYLAPTPPHSITLAFLVFICKTKSGTQVQNLESFRNGVSCVFPPSDVVSLILTFFCPHRLSLTFPTPKA